MSPRNLIGLSACLIAIALPVRAADFTTVSPRKTFTILQHRGEFFTTRLRFAKGSQPEMVLAGKYTWPGLFYISPDERWVLWVQKTGSGENMAMLYQFDANRHLRRTKPNLDDLAFAHLARTAGISRRGMYHTGVEFIAWDLKRPALIFSVSGGVVDKSGAPINGRKISRKVSYDLLKHSLRSL